MNIYPTIHIRSGRCYNPTDADTLHPNIYTCSPIKLANLWEEAGASWLHIVDVDGAMLGYPVHDTLIAEIAGSVSIPVQSGGGIRSVKDIDHMLSLGVQRVVCGTSAYVSSQFVRDAIEHFGDERFIVGVDAVNGMVATEGREILNKYNAVSLVHSMQEIGVKTIVYTDVDSAMRQNPFSIENTRELIRRTGVSIIYGGGINSLMDMRDIAGLSIDGVVIGAALYNGRIDLSEAIRLFERPIDFTLPNA